MPKIPKHLQGSQKAVSPLLKLLQNVVQRPVGLNPSILLYGNIPKPMHEVNPRTVLGVKWWNAERTAAYASTDYHCEACGVSKYEAKFHQWLESHESYKIDYAKGTMTYLRAVPLCHACHSFIHCGRLQALLDQGLISQQRYALIIQHGDAVLKAAGLPKSVPYSGPFAPWHRWRLIVNNKKYPPKYKTQAAWEKAHTK